MLSAHYTIIMAYTHIYIFLPYPPFSTPSIAKHFIKMTIFTWKIGVTSTKWKASLNCSLLFLQGHCVHAKSLQSCPTLYNPMDCSLPGSSVRGILQARMSSSGDVPDPGIEPVSPILQADSLPLSHQGSPPMSADA